MRKTNKQRKQAFFDKHKNRPLAFVIVTDINMKDNPHYYKAIFRDIKDDTYHVYKLTPEMMNYKYKPGDIYLNGDRIGRNKSILCGEFLVNTNPNLSFVRLSKAINENDVDIITQERYKKFFLRQFAYVEKQKDCTLIIPCYTIANRFYFLSSSIKQSVMNGSLADFYYSGSFRSEKYNNNKVRVKVHIKKKAGVTYLPQICRFIGHRFSQEQFKYIARQKGLMRKDHPYGPIKATYPVQYEFKINTTYVCLGEDDRGQPKYLVLNILSDTIGYGFDEIQYKIYKEGEDPREVEPDTEELPEDPPEGPSPKPPKRAPKRDNKIYEGVPFDEYIQYMIMLKDDESHLDSKQITISGEQIFIGGENNSNTHSEDKQVGNSFEPGSSDGDKDLGSTAVGDHLPANKNKKKEIFHLEDFYQFYEMLLTYAGVYGDMLEEPYEIKRKPQGSKNPRKRKVIFGANQEMPRRYILAQISYAKKNVYFIEIEQDESWGPSTWILVDKSTISDYIHEDMRGFIERYIEEDTTYGRLKTYLKKQKGLYFEHKNHKKSKIDEIAIQKWCDEVLRKIRNIDKPSKVKKAKKEEQSNA